MWILPDLGPGLSEHFRWTVRPGSAPRWSSLQGMGHWRPKNIGNVTGLILEGRSCESFRCCGVVRQECKASRIIGTHSSSSWGPSRSDPSVLFFFFWVLTSRLQCCHCCYPELFRGCRIKLTALSPFFFSGLFLDFISAAFKTSHLVYLSQFSQSFHQALMYVFFSPRVLIMHYTDSMLGK